MKYVSEAASASVFRQGRHLISKGTTRLGAFLV